MTTPATTDVELQREQAPASTSSSLPHLDLRQRREQPSVVDVVLRASSVTAGLHTKTCPHCGVNPAGPPVKRTFQYVPPWVYIGLVLNIVVLAILYAAGRRVIKGTVTLCPDCDVADRRGRTIRGVSLVGIVGFPALLAGLGALVAGEDGAIVGALAGIVAFIAGIVAAHRSTRFDVIGCKLIDKKADSITLTSSPAFRRVLRAEAPQAIEGR